MPFNETIAVFMTHDSKIASVLSGSHIDGVKPFTAEFLYIFYLCVKMQSVFFKLKFPADILQKNFRRQQVR